MLFVEASEIVPNLWQGSFPEPGEFVRASGFSMLVLCAIEHQEPKESYPGVEVVYAPNYDDGAHRLNHARLRVALDAAKRVTAAVKAEQRVLVTCAAGMNRSGLVTGIALHMLFGWDGSTCVDRVREKRHRWKGYQPMSNPDFTAALRKLTLSATQAPSGWQLTETGVLVPV